MDTFEHRLAKQRLAPPPTGLREQVLRRAAEAARSASAEVGAAAAASIQTQDCGGATPERGRPPGFWAVFRGWFYPSPAVWAGLCGVWILILGMNRYASWIPERTSMQVAGPGRWPTLAAWIGERRADFPGVPDGHPDARDAVAPPSRPPRRSDAGLPGLDLSPWRIGKYNDGPWFLS